MNRAYEEITDWLAGGFTLEALVAYQPFDEVREQVVSLSQQSKTAELTHIEASAPAHYIRIEHLLQLANARARHRLVASVRPTSAHVGQ